MRTIIYCIPKIDLTIVTNLFCAKRTEKNKLNRIVTKIRSTSIFVIVIRQLELLLYVWVTHIFSHDCNKTEKNQQFNLYT